LIPSKPVLKSDECRCLQNGRVARIVTPRAKYFPAPGVFENPPETEKCGLVFIPPNLAASVRCTILGHCQSSNPNYQTLNLERSRESSGESALESVIVAPNGST
jgi:hypothetical protein